MPKKTDVVLTGRFAPRELFDKTDFVNEIIDIKYPEELISTKGIQYCGESELWKTIRLFLLLKISYDT
ncbi:hypothetical protein KAU88_01365 [Candidatus Bathyarchaeota archaeon]|nr:hypothetical protein [Candidatus Bathyarchaeota archaeon]